MRAASSGVATFEVTGLMGTPLFMLFSTPALLKFTLLGGVATAGIGPPDLIRGSALLNKLLDIVEESGCKVSDLGKAVDGKKGIPMFWETGCALAAFCKG